MGIHIVMAGISRACVVILALLVISTIQFTPRRTRKRYPGRTRVKELCKDRVFNEFFRDQTDDCAKVVKCDSSRTGLSTVTCSAPLVFDIDTQICNYQERVNNCDRANKIPECSDEERDVTKCIPKVEEESVETKVEDPNFNVPECDRQKCVLPNCYCSVDGTLAPGVEELGLDIKEVPQMIMISFNGAVTGENMVIYERLFSASRVNPNGCTAKGSFYVSHKYTNYSAVQELHRKGHEIGVFSITNEDQPKYWTEGNYDTWLAEMAGSRLIIEQFANITDSTVVGVRAPYLKVGGNEQFEMMTDQFFAYDSSIAAPLGRVPIWPYSLHYRMPHKCHGNGGNCPSRSHPIWELPINELDRRDDPDFDENLTGCHLVSSCSNIYHKDQFRRLLDHNFNRHYTSNKAPLSLSFEASWLVINKGFLDVLDEWMDHILLTYQDAYFVTELQVLQWIQNPTNNQGLRDFQDWKDKCTVKGQPFCHLPNACPLTTRELPGETLRLHTCEECPRNYPWILDPTGDGFSF